MRPHEAQFAVGMAESTFKFMIDLAVERNFFFVRRDAIDGLMPGSFKGDQANWRAVCAHNLLSPLDRLAADEEIKAFKAKMRAMK